MWALRSSFVRSGPAGAFLDCAAAAPDDEVEIGMAKDVIAAPAPHVPARRPLRGGPLGTGFPGGKPSIAQSGMLSCFFQGCSISLVRSMPSARAMRLRVEWGMITSSI